jgi:hypothetical protein
VIDLAGILPYILIGNSLFILTFIFNQNESVKDATNQNSVAPSNPFENFTWICFIFQLLFLLLKTKLTDF